MLETVDWINFFFSKLFLNMFTLYYSSYQQTYQKTNSRMIIFIVKTLFAKNAVKKKSQMDVTSSISVVNFFLHSFISLSSCFPL